jgi:hypothetical protein
LGALAPSCARDHIPKKELSFMRTKHSKLKLLAAGAALTVAGLFTAGSAMAFPSSSYAMRCDGCSNPDIQQNLQEGFSTQDIVYVYSMTGRTLRLFTRHGQPGGGFVFTENPVDAASTAYFQLVLQWYDGNHGSLAYVDNVALNLIKTQVAHLPLRSATWGTNSPRAMSDVGPPHASPNVGPVGSSLSAYDAVNEGFYRDQVAAYLNSTKDTDATGFWVRAAQMVGMAYGDVRSLTGADNAETVRLGIQSLGAFVDVNFPDGSSMRFGWDPGSHGFLYVPHTAKDGSGNQIPDAPADVGGANGAPKIYVFAATPQGTNDAISFNQRVQTLFGGSAPAPSTPATLACVYVTGGTPTCTLQQ